MSTYRFKLDNSRPRRKLTCPQCGGRKCFTPYIDLCGEHSFPEYVGLCDHKHRCGYHFTPADYFKQHPTSRHMPNTPMPKIPTPEPKPTLYIDSALMHQTLKGYEHNALFKFLRGIIGEEECRELFLRYNVGTAKMMGESTVFWQVDFEGRIRTGKIMLYGSDGHRVKTDGARLNWVHAVMRMSGSCQMVQCFFGEHLLARHPDKKVVIVESEKSALIASFFFPDYLWLASGGCDGCLNPTASQVLKGREVKLLPDLGMEEKWQAKAEMLRPICKSIDVLTWLSNNATDEQRIQGLDVADFIIEAIAPAPQTAEKPPELPDAVATSPPIFYDDADLPFPMPDPNEVCPF